MLGRTNRKTERIEQLLRRIDELTGENRALRRDLAQVTTERDAAQEELSAKPAGVWTACDADGAVIQTFTHTLDAWNFARNRNRSIRTNTYAPDGTLEFDGRQWR